MRVVHQMQLPKGATIMAIIIASDKTHLTNFSGNKSIHAVYISLGNINKDDCRKLSRGCSLLLAEIPTPNFEKTALRFQTASEQKEMPGILKREIYHMCLGIVLDLLCKAAQSMASGEIMELSPTIDADGMLRMCAPILMAWIADLEEQWTLLGLAQNSCPKCLARWPDLGNPHACSPRSGQWILSKLAEICTQYPDADTWQFVQKAKEEGLCGVEVLCWRELPVDMCCAICLDILHTVHKGFYDHLLLWTSRMVGERALDAAYMVQPH